MTAVTNCRDFGAPKNKACHCFHGFPIYLPWSCRLKNDLQLANCELNFIWGKMRTLAQEPASQIALRDCSKAAVGEVQYIRFWWRGSSTSWSTHFTKGFFPQPALRLLFKGSHPSETFNFPGFVCGTLCRVMEIVLKLLSDDLGLKLALSFKSLWPKAVTAHFFAFLPWF